MNVLKIAPSEENSVKRVKFLKNILFAGYFWVCTASQSSETRLSSHLQPVHILSAYCAGTDIYTFNINRKRFQSGTVRRGPNPGFRFCAELNLPTLHASGCPPCLWRANTNYSLTSLRGEIIPPVGSWGPSKKLCWAVPKRDGLCLRCRPWPSCERW